MVATTGVMVRPMTSADATLVKRVWLHALRSDPKAFIAKTQLEKRCAPAQLMRNCIWVTAWREGEVVGIARMLPAEEPRARYIERVWVDGRFRRTGVLRSMLEDLEWRASQAGASELWLWVLETNDKAQDAYKRLGFQQATQKSVRKDLNEIRMTKTLP